MKIWNFITGLPITTFKVITMKTLAQILASLTVLSILAFPAVADAGIGVSWDDLNTYEQRVLAEIQDQWAALPPASQTQLQQAAERWLNRSIHRANFDMERLERWQTMSEAERKRLRKGFQRFQSLSDSEQEKVRHTRQRFEKLDPQEKERWRQRWEAMTPEERAELQAIRAERRAQHHGRAGGDDHHRHPARRHKSDH